ncbi:NAD(P)/FAD-dependent oxidoreductase [Mycoplasma sp. P36-A1]|uniref:NAD(P)/FAD-dependent oxidoreductase n=1 Tax=Mycoplasma sp. P36-A1 TaxID=3252900 RepID=UPI003C300435
MEIKDVSIIGAGPIGMYATVYSLIRVMSVNLIESMPEYGGQPNSSYPQKDIYDLPMFTNIKAEDVIARLESQIEYNRKDLLDVTFNEEIVKIEKEQDYFKITGKDNKEYYSKTILLTTGSGILTPRKIGIENEDKLPNIFYTVKDLAVFDNKTVSILGGGDSALDWALILKDSAKKVNIVHRRNEYRAKEDSIEKLNNSNVNQYMNYLVEEVNEVANHTEITLQEKDTKNEVKLEQDIILVNYGNVSKVSDFGGLKVASNVFGYETNRLFETNIEGLYACGNAAHYEGKPKLISVGFGEVPVVINTIKGYVDPSSKGKVFYSSVSASK